MLNIKIDIYIYIYIIKNNTLIILNNVNNLKKKSEFQTCFLSFVVEAESRVLMDDRETVVETRVNTYYNLFYCVNLKISWYRWLRNSRVV